MIIDDRLFDSLLAEAAASPRLRVIRDLRNSPADRSQRALNAMMPGTVVPVHRHKHTSETLIVLRGELTELLYDADGNQTEARRLRACSPAIGIQVPKGCWHTVVAHEPTVIVEVKDGPYEPLAPDDILRDEP